MNLVATKIKEWKKNIWRYVSMCDTNGLCLKFWKD